MIIIYVLFLFWVWVFMYFGNVGLYGDNAKSYNDQLQFINDMFYFKHMPDVIIEDDTPNSIAPNCRSIIAVEEDIDCRDFCKDETAEYFTVDENQIIISDNKELKPGSYCKIGKNGICNPFTTIILYTSQGWSCYNKFFHFGGTGGNKIMICNGKLKDSVTNQTYVDYIPNNLFLNDPHEIDDSTGDYRFKCADESKISQITGYNTMPIQDDEKLRFFLVTNPCSLSLKGTVEYKYNYDDGSCECGEQFLDSDLKQCTTCLHKTDTAAACVKCYDPWLPRLGSQNLLPCYHGSHIYTFAPTLKYNEATPKDTGDAVLKNITFGTAITNKASY